MRVKNFFITILMLGLVVYGGLKLYMYFQAKKDIDALFAPARMVMDVKYEQISTSVFGPVGIRGLEFSIPQIGEKITVGEFKLLNYDNIGKMMDGALPSRFHFSITDLHFNLALIDKIEKQARLTAQRRGQVLPPNEDNTPVIIRRLGYRSIFEKSNDLQALGYKELTMDFELDMQFNPTTREAKMMVSESVDDMGAVRIDLLLADLASTIHSAVLGFKIKDMKIKYRDDSYVDRLLTVFAQQENMELDAYRRKVVAQIDKDITEKQIKLNSDSVKSLQQFIENPKQLIITSYPYKPVGIESIKHYRPGDVPVLLNLQFFLQ